MRFFTYICVLLLLAGCMGGGSKVKETTVDSKGSDSTTATAETSAETQEAKPLVDQKGATGSTATVTVYGDIPMETRKTNIKKAASYKTTWDMSFREFYKAYSAWMYIIMAVAAGMFWRLFQAISAKVKYSSIGGGLKVFGSIMGNITSRLTQAAPQTQEWYMLNQLKHDFQEKEGKLKTKEKG